MNDILVINAPTLIKQGAILDSIAGFLWSDDEGPLENILGYADYATWLMPFGLTQILMILSSMMGYDFKSLGKWLDESLGLKTIEDLANLDVSSAINKLVGNITRESYNDYMSSAISSGVVGQISSSAALYFPAPLIKNAAEREDTLDELQKVVKRRGTAVKDPGLMDAEKKYFTDLAKYKAGQISKKEFDKSYNDYNKIKRRVDRANEWQSKRLRKKLFGGDIMGAKAAKGMKGAALFGLTNLLMWAVKIGAALFKGGGKAALTVAKAHPLKTLFALGAGAFGIYRWAKDGLDKVADVEPDNAFSKEVSDVIGQAGTNKGSSVKQPDTFEEKIGFLVNDVMLRAINA